MSLAMEEVTNKEFYNKLKNSLASKGKKTYKLEPARALNGTFLNTPFTTPFGNNTYKRDLLINDSLLNEHNFVKYWKSREKNRNPNILPHQIKYGGIADNDGDGNPEFVAYYDDGSKSYLLGYNQYVVGPPMNSQKKAKAEYYKMSSADRKNQSYADYLASNKNLLTGWMTPKQIQKYTDKVEKQLLTVVKKFFTEHADGFTTLKPALKTKIANIFIKIVANSMIDDGANDVHAEAIKTIKQFSESKKEFIKALIESRKVQNRATEMVKQIVAGNAFVVENYITPFAKELNVYIEKEDVKELFNALQQKSYVRSQSSDIKVDEQAYNKWLGTRYAGHNPNTTEIVDLDDDTFDSIDLDE